MWEGKLGRTVHHGTPQTSLLPSPMSDNFPSDRVVSEDTGDGGGARSPPRSGGRRRHCAPRLASYLSRAGPGSREFLAPTTRRWGGAYGNFREQSRFHRTKTSRPMPEGASYNFET